MSWTENGEHDWRWAEDVERDYEKLFEAVKDYFRGRKITRTGGPRDFILTLLPECEE